MSRLRPVSFGIAADLSTAWTSRNSFVMEGLSFGECSSRACCGGFCTTNTQTSAGASNTVTSPETGYEPMADTLARRGQSAYASLSTAHFSPELLLAPGSRFLYHNNMVHYEVINTTNQSLLIHAIERGLRVAETKAGDLSNRFVSIEFVSSEESRKLNYALRATNAPTDCISMSTHDSEAGHQVIKRGDDGSLNFHIERHKSSSEHNDEPPQKGPPWPMLGQLVVCLPQVAHNAAQAGQPVERELEWVIEHGMLHLLGFHHDKD